MQAKSPNSNEQYVGEILQKILSEMDFTVNFADTNREPNPDYLAVKKLTDVDYRIAIELKSNRNAIDAIKYGIKTLSHIQTTGNYDKLLLVLLNHDSTEKFQPLLSKFFHQNPVGIEIVNLNTIDKWANELRQGLEETDDLNDGDKEQNQALIVLTNMCKELIRLIAKNPKYLKSIEWRNFEHTLAEVFFGLGFSVELTPESKDGGKDLILECVVDDMSKSFIIEIKHWRSEQKVGSTIVKDFVRVIVNENRNKGMILSSYGFSGNYYESLSEYERTLIHFGEKEKVYSLCKTYEKKKNGLWNPISSLEDVLFEDTVHYC